MFQCIQGRTFSLWPTYWHKGYEYWYDPDGPNIPAYLVSYFHDF